MKTRRPPKTRSPPDHSVPGGCRPLQMGPAEALGIVETSHHVKAVRGDCNRRLTSSEETSRKGLLLRVHSNIWTHHGPGNERSGTLPSLSGGVVEGRGAEEFLLPRLSRRRTTGGRRLRQRVDRKASDEDQGHHQSKTQLHD